MPQPPRPPILLAVGDGGVRFERIGDRWHHAVFFGGVTWRSVEGPAEADERHPASPAFVEVTRLGSAADAPVMAVGQAGRTHFSAVILPDPAFPGAIRFDLAARVNEPPRALGSTYVASPGPPCPLRIVPTDGDATLPRTIRWSYRFSPDGPAALEGASLAAAAGGVPPVPPTPA